MSNAGRARARLHRALERGSLSTILAAAAAVERLELDEALAICARVARDEPEQYSRYAARWISLYIERRSPTLAELRSATDVLIDLGVERSLPAALADLGI